MENIFIISDTHFGHANILTFSNADGSPVRSFSCVEEMDQHMIDRWNSVVRPQDHVYHLGDVAMKRPYLDTIGKCNGHKRLVRGNHDIFRTKDYLKYFDEVYATRVLDGMIFTHIPIHPESMGRFGVNVHGHVHGMPARNLWPKILQRVGRSHELYANFFGRPEEKSKGVSAVLIREYALRTKKTFPPEVIYAGEFLENLGHIFLVDFGASNAVDKAADQYIAYLEYVYQREFNGY